MRFEKEESVVALHLPIGPFKNPLWVGAGFIYGYMASDIWLRTILIVRKETRCRHIGYSYRLTARGLLYAPSHRQDNTYRGLCYTSCGALAGTMTQFKNTCLNFRNPNSIILSHISIQSYALHSPLKIPSVYTFLFGILIIMSRSAYRGWGGPCTPPPPPKKKKEKIYMF